MNFTGFESINNGKWVRDITAILVCSWVTLGPANAQSCGTACGSIDEVTINFYGSGGASAADSSSTVVSTMTLNGVTVQSLVVAGSAQAVTSTGTALNIKDGEVYRATLTFNQSDPTKCLNSSAVYFSMKGGCGKTLQIFSGGQWVDSSSATTEFAYLNNNTFEVDIQVVKKAGDGSGGASTVASTSPPTVSENSSANRSSTQFSALSEELPPINPATFGSSVPLGSTPQSAGYNVGSLAISGPITPSLGSVSNLRVNGVTGGGVDVVQDSGNVRQVKNSIRLGDVQPVVGGGFQVRFYEAGAFGDTLVGGLYPINSGAVPSSTVSYIPVAADGSIHSGGIRVVSASPGQPIRATETVSTSSEGDSWRVTEFVDGIEMDTRDFSSAFFMVDDELQRTDLQETRRGGVLLSKSIRTYLYQTRMEGDPAVTVENNEFLVSETIFSSETSSETTTWKPDPSRIGRIRSVTRPDGSWEVYHYYIGDESIANGDPMDAYASWAGLLKLSLKPLDGTPADPTMATVANSVSTFIAYDSPSTTPGVGFGPQQTRRTTYLPGGVIRIKDWEKVSATANVATLVAVLTDAGISSSWLPLQADLRSESGMEYASATEGIPSTAFFYAKSHVQGNRWIGSNFASLDAEGNGSVTGYQHGTYDALSGVFTPSNLSLAQSTWGTDIRATTVKVVSFGASPADGEATRNISIVDRFGKPLLTELSIKDGSGAWSSATATTYEYPALWPDGTVKETLVKQDGRIISHTINELSGSDMLTTVFDEQGAETRTLKEASGRIKTVTRVGVPAADGHKAQPDRVTSYTYSGHTTTIVTTAAELSRIQVSVVDLQGRAISETDPSGATTLTSYPNSGRDTLTTLPGGLTRLLTKNADGRNISITGTAVVDEFYDYAYANGGVSPGNLVITHRIGDLLNSPRFQSAEMDWADRPIKVWSPSPTGVGEELVTSLTGYQPNTRRQVFMQSVSGSQLLQKPDPSSDKTYSGFDLDNSLTLEPASIDRVSEIRNYYVEEEGYWWQVSTQKRYDVDGSDETALSSITKRCLHGMPGGSASKSVTISPEGEVKTLTTFIDRAKKKLTLAESTSIAERDSVTVMVNGLAVSRMSYDSLVPIRWEHNGLGDVVKETNSKGASNISTYYADGSILTVTDSSGKTTTYEYFGPAHASAGKVSRIINPFGKDLTYLYSNLGQVTEEAGAAGYKVTYEYDDYGVRNKMFTWRDSVTSDSTEWVYQPGTGLLESKIDADGKSVSYTYNSSGKVHVRTWARIPQVTTTYEYQTPGDLIAISYSDDTPDVTLSGLDRLGRPTTITQAGTGSEHFTYHPGKNVQNARFYDTAHALIPGIGIRSSAPDSNGRPTGFQETSGADTSVLRSVSYGYDSSGRFESITDDVNSHIYRYKSNTSLISTVDSLTGGSSWFRESRYYDSPGRLLGIRSDRMAGTTVVNGISSHAYKLDDLGRRIRNTIHDGSYWEYGYNDRSEVVSAVRKTANGSAIPQLAASYTYDGIGNRLTSNSPILGDHTYTPNLLNQYTSITTGASRTAIGRAPLDWNVEVNGFAADRTGELYHLQVEGANGPVEPDWKEVITRRDSSVPTSLGQFWFASTPFSPVYDADGNLTDDGRWLYKWDAENRLIQIESCPQAVAAGHPYIKVVNAYDWQGRRIAEHVWKGGTTITPSFATSIRWLYDGWNPVAEFVSSSDTSSALTRQQIFTWGLDLSGSLQGAGGVGGLLTKTSVGSGVVYAASYDGNGNIVAWIRSTDSAPIARREYDAFGNTLVSEGIWPSRFGFSTKMQNIETGLYYYGYRFYDPTNGRWLSKDPLGEMGGLNLYGFVTNDGLNRADFLGLNFWGGFGNIVTGVAAGAISGAVTGAVTGALIGFVVGGPPGALAGLAAGATAGAVSGAIAGGVGVGINMVTTGNSNFDPLDSAVAGAISGGISGVLSGVGAGAGVWAAQGGKGVLTHFTKAEVAVVINASGQLGKNASTALWATTGGAAGTTVAGSTGIRIVGEAARQFTPVRAAGVFTAYGQAAGFQSAGRGVIDLSTGLFVQGGGANLTLVKWYVLEFGIAGLIGAASSELDEKCLDYSYKIRLYREDRILLGGSSTGGDITFPPLR